MEQTRDQRRRQAMYQMNDLDMWNQRRNDLLREAENGRLTRLLKATRPARTTWFRNMLSARAIEAPSRLCVEDGGRT
jgi:flagellar motor switch protein FliG